MNKDEIRKELDEIKALLARARASSVMVPSLYFIEARPEADSPAVGTPAAKKEYRGLLEKVFGESSIAWWEFNLANGEIGFSKKQARLLDYESRGSAHFSEITSIIHPDDLEQAANDVREIRNGNSLEYHSVFRLRNRQQEYLWHEVQGFVAEADQKGHPAVLVGTIYNITPFKQMEAEKESLSRDLNERIKELNCIFAVSKALKSHDREPDEAMRQVISHVQERNNSTARTGVRIRMEGQDYLSEGFEESPWRIVSESLSEQPLAGQIELFYAESADYDQALAADERELLNEVSRQISIYWEARRARAALEESRKLLDELVDLRTQEITLLNRRLEKEMDILKTREERFRNLLDSLPQRILCKDRDSNYIAANRAYAALFATDSDSLAGRSDFDLLPRNEAEKQRSEDRKVMESAMLLEYDEEYSLDDEVRYCHMIKAPLCEDGGAVVGILAISWDVTAERMAANNLRRYSQDLEKQLRERSEELLHNDEQLQSEIRSRQLAEKTLQENLYFSNLLIEKAFLPHFIMDVSLNGILYANARALEFSKASLQELSEDGMALLFWVDDRDRDIVQGYLNEMGEVESYYCPVYRLGSGEIRPIRLTAFRTKYAGQEAVAVSIQDLGWPSENSPAFMALAESAPTGMMHIDQRGMILYVNRAMAILCGSSQEEMEGRSLFNYLDPADWEKECAGGCIDMEACISEGWKNRRLRHEGDGDHDVMVLCTEAAFAGDMPRGLLVHAVSGLMLEQSLDDREYPVWDKASSPAGDTKAGYASEVRAESQEHDEAGPMILAGRERLGCDQDKYQELLRLYISSQSGILSRILDCIDNDENDEAAVLLHGLKSSAGIIGAVSLHKEAAGLEEAIARGEERVFIIRGLIRLESIFQTTMDHITRDLSGNAEAQSERQPISSPPEALAAVRRLVIMLDRDISQAQEYWSENRDLISGLIGDDDERDLHEALEAGYLERCLVILDYYL